jgi:3-methyladenine DNA glycosylase AlkD
MNSKDIIKNLKSYANPKNVEGMARFGISGKNVLGGPNLLIIRKMAREIKKQEIDCHKLAQELWDSEIHEARILAGHVDDPTKVTQKQMESWVKDFDSWDVCDCVCANLFDKTPFVYQKIGEWTKRKEEFVKRAGFVLMAALAVHDKKADSKIFLKFLPIIVRESTDERNFVKKAVNWALRQIGKRNRQLQKAAISTAQKLQKSDNRTARWIGNDAFRELKNKTLKA